MDQTFSQYYQKDKKIIVPLALIIFFLSLIFNHLYLNLGNRWWFEDDSVVIAHAATAKSIFEPFYNSKLAKDYGAGNAMAPMQLVSLWIDIKLDKLNPDIYYFHNNIASSVLTSALFIVLALFVSNYLVAFVMSLIWMLLPSTLVLIQFTAARHYIEGGMFFLIGVILTLLTDITEINKKEKRSNDLINFLLISLFLWFGALNKEIWAVTAFGFLFLWGVFRREKIWIVTGLVYSLLYFIYRYVLVGTSLVYQAKKASFTQYLEFVGSLPYVFGSNRVGYLLLLFAVLIFLYAYFYKSQDSHENSKSNLLYNILLISLILVPNILALYPISRSVLETFHSPSTWYRVVIVINLYLIFIFSTVFVLRVPKLLKGLFLISLIVTVSYGAVKTKKWWSDRYRSLEAEGKFFIENPDKILYSEDPAYWFLSGLVVFYNLPERPFLNPYHENYNKYLELLRTNPDKYPTVYVRKDFEIVPSDERYRHILR